MIEPPVPVEIEFRDGKRQVPEYLAAVMEGLETWRLTYDQAVVEANKRMGADYVTAAHERILTKHFKDHRRWD
jgi:hypothetical protein